MCRNIRPLFNFEPPAGETDVRNAALQFVRKIAGTTKPSKANAHAFDHAVDEITESCQRLLAAMVTTARTAMAIEPRRRSGPPRTPSPAGASTIDTTRHSPSRTMTMVTRRADVGLMSRPARPPSPRTATRNRRPNTTRTGIANTSAAWRRPAYAWPRPGQRNDRKTAMAGDR